MITEKESLRHLHDRCICLGYAACRHAVVYPAPEQNQTAGSSQSGQQPRPYARHRTAPGQTLQLSARLSPSSEVFHYRKVIGSSLARQVHLIKVKTCSLSVEISGRQEKCP